MSGWRPDDGITESGGSRADDQVSDFYIVRFRYPGLPNALVTCKSYAYTGVPAIPGVFYVATDIERLTCADPARRNLHLARHRARRGVRHLAHRGRSAGSGLGHRRCLAQVRRPRRLGRPAGLAARRPATTVAGPAGRCPASTSPGTGRRPAGPAADETGKKSKPRGAHAWQL